MPAIMKYLYFLSSNYSYYTISCYLLFIFKEPYRKLNIGTPLLVILMIFLLFIKGIVHFDPASRIKAS